MTHKYSYIYLVSISILKLFVLRIHRPFLSRNVLINYQIFLKLFRIFRNYTINWQNGLFDLINQIFIVFGYFPTSYNFFDDSNLKKNYESIVKHWNDGRTSNINNTLKKMSQSKWKIYKNIQNWKPYQNSEKAIFRKFFFI